MEQIIEKIFSDEFAAMAQIIIFGLMTCGSIVAAMFAPWQWLIAVMSGVMLVSGIAEYRRVEKTTNNK